MTPRPLLFEIGCCERSRTAPHLFDVRTLRPLLLRIVSAIAAVGVLVAAVSTSAAEAAPAHSGN